MHSDDVVGQAEALGEACVTQLARVRTRGEGCEVLIAEDFCCVFGGRQCSGKLLFGSSSLDRRRDLLGGESLELVERVKLGRRWREVWGLEVIYVILLLLAAVVRKVVSVLLVVGEMVCVVERLVVDVVPVILATITLRTYYLNISIFVCITLICIIKLFYHISFWIRVFGFLCCRRLLIIGEGIEFKMFRNINQKHFIVAQGDSHQTLNPQHLLAYNAPLAHGGYRLTQQI